MGLRMEDLLLANALVQFGFVSPDQIVHDGAAPLDQALLHAGLVTQGQLAEARRIARSGRLPTPSQSALTAPDPLSMLDLSSSPQGFWFGPFRILSKLGEGGMGGGVPGGA
jgi:hypothetical protein